MRVHEARIATVGARAEDLFLIADGDDRPLDEAQCEDLRTALRAALDAAVPV